MNKPDKAIEPSMDEILASIRKIIAEEPSQARADGEGTSNPLLTGTELRHGSPDRPFSMNDRPRPSLDRLSSALKARATAPPPAPPAASLTRPSPFGIEPPASFDDLADLLDEPSVPHKLAESLPRLELQPRAEGVLHAFVAAPAISEADVDAIDEAISALPGDMDAATPPGNEPALPEETVQAASTDAPSVPPAPAAPPDVSPWESMRKKNGYWPPQVAASSKPAPVASAAPDTDASVNGGYAPGSGPFPPKEIQQSQGSLAAPSATADLIARLHAGLSEQPVPPERAAPTQIQFGVPLGASAPAAAPPVVNGANGHHPMNGAMNGSMNGIGYTSPPAAPNNFVPPFPAARPPEPAAPPQPPAPEPYARPLSADAMMNAALAQLISGGAAPAAPDPYARPHAAPDTGDRYHPGPYAQSNPYAPNPYAPNPYAQSYAPVEPDPTTVAAAAFDALAQGLAGSPRPEPRRAYDYHTPVASQPHTALVAQPLLPAVQDYHPMVVRTLEDAVADMLKPMLQKWLSDNMPRIIERALRVEAASGMKPPGSS